jgi:crotonobetainyl-CoA:carnitine CoA-transferase CaiB-like acyl-CoA transferase
MRSNAALLEGIRVTDLTTVIFGPYCTHMLADMGADVIKVEPKHGDNGRTIGRSAKTPGMGAMHMNINRGKRSVSWDLKTRDGHEKLCKLIASSDVFIHNIRLDAIKRIGLDYDSVRAFAPDIIYVQCTGFDTDGPDAGTPAYDDIIQGSSGLASLLSRVDGQPDARYIPTAVADKTAGLYALQGTLAAIIHKLRFGGGQYVEIPMFEAVVDYTLVEHFGAAVFPDIGRKMGYARQISTTRQPSPTADGYICLAPYNDDRWLRFFEVIGRMDILDEERFSTERLRQRNRDQLYALVNTLTPSKTTAEWLALMRANDIPARQVNSLEDLLTDPQLQAVGFFRERVHPTEGRYLEVRPAVKFSARPAPALGFAPHVGEHNHEVEAELGLAPDAP